MKYMLRPIAIGDVHGEVTLLRALLHQLPPKGARFIFLGDYMDYGGDAVGTIQFLTALARSRACVFLRGNHDSAWLETWTGTRFVQCPEIVGAEVVWEQTHGQVPPLVGTFLARTVIDWEDEYAFYAHAGAQPGTAFHETPTEVKLWGDEEFLDSPYDWGKPVVFGHFELDTPLLTPTKMGIDTAAYRTGILTALDVLPRRVIQVTR
jgi:serine/threonine protein phosphatase 1